MRTGRKWFLLFLLALVWFGAAPLRAQRREYLKDEEIAKIRDAQEPNERTKLFLKFASERLLRFQQLLANPGMDDKQAPSRREALNDLLAGFTACVDDAAETLETGSKRGAQLTKGLVEMLKLAPGYLKTLEELQKNPGAEFSAYAETLDDSLQAVRDALEEAKKLQAEQGRRAGEKDKR